MAKPLDGRELGEEESEETTDMCRQDIPFPIKCVIFIELMLDEGRRHYIEPHCQPSISKSGNCSNPCTIYFKPVILG
jgi:hypothetical protein